MTQDAASAASILDQIVTARADERARILVAQPDPQRTLSALVELAERVALSDVHRADIATHAVMELADGVGSTLHRARARRARARALSFQGRYHEALGACTDGLCLAQEAGSAIDAARTRLASMHALGELGRLDEAIRVGEQARDEFLAVEEPSLAARAEINIGVAWQRRDEPAIAVACFERARPLVAHEPTLLGPLENNRGEAMLAMADFAGAEQAFTSALKAFELADSKMASAIVEGNLADLAVRQGRLQKAMVHFERARRSLEQDAASGHLARLLSEQADAMAALGMPWEALREYESALVELDRHGLKLEAARARTGMGLALLKLDRHAQAETALAAAATAFEELGHETARAKVDLVRSELAASYGRFADAQRLAMQSLAVLHDRPVEAARVRYVLGQLAVKLGRAHEAEAEYGLGLALARELDLAPLLAELYSARGGLRLDQHRLVEAVSDLTQAVEHVERVRGALHADRFRAAFSGNRASIYLSLVAALLEVGDESAIARAFAVSEMARSRSLLELMQAMISRSPDTPESPPEPADHRELALLDELEHVRAELNALYSGLAGDRTGTSAHQPTKGDSWQSHVRNREHQLEAIEARLATTSHARQGLAGLYAATIDLPNALRAVPANTALVSYVGTEAGIAAFVLHNGRCHAVRHLGSTTTLATHIQAMHFQVNRALRPSAMDGARGERLILDARRVLDDLGTLLVEPILPMLHGAEQVVIVPHGQLHMVPFSTLRVGGKYLLELFDTQCAPSATVFAHLQQSEALREIGPKDSAVIVGVEDEIAPGIAQEAQYVAAQIQQSTLLCGPHATAENVVGQITQASIIHMACHGRFSAEAPMSSGLRLSDRWLTIRDIYQTQLNARLVTLSGCETGVNLVKAGDDLMGLVRAFLAAGSSSVLASLWRVDDRATREFMRHFYGSWSRLSSGIPKARLLRDAQLATMQQHPHPAFWAPFVLIGSL